MPPDTPIASPPNVTGDSLAQIATAIGPWGFVACVALVVTWKVATKYLDVLAQRKEVTDSALTELVETVAALKKEYEEDSVTRAQRLKALDALCDSVAALQKDQDQDREYVTHTDFIEWLKQQEENEKRAIHKYESAYGKFQPYWSLESPARIAESILKG